VKRGFERRLEMMCKGHIYKFAYEFFIDVCVGLFAVVGELLPRLVFPWRRPAVWPWNTSLLDWMLRCQHPNIGVGAWDMALAVQD